MNSEQAKAVLMHYRPWVRPDGDPRMEEALELAKWDPGLGEWLAGHVAYQERMRVGLRGVEPPDGLRAQIREPGRVVVMADWLRWPSVWAAAAVVVVGLLIGVWMSLPRMPDRFADFRERMVRTVLREYRMDLETSDLAAVREYMAMRSAPADFKIPVGLRNLSLTGGGLLRWRNHPVSMLCFDRGDQEMLFLFVMAEEAVADAPSGRGAPAPVSRLETISWSEEGRLYVLAGKAEAGFPDRYLASPQTAQ